MRSVEGNRLVTVDMVCSTCKGLIPVLCAWDKEAIQYLIFSNRMA